MNWFRLLLEGRRDAWALVEADADQLIEYYGPDAYRVALNKDTRVGRPLLDGNRPAKHWIRVRRELRRRGIEPDFAK